MKTNNDQNEQRSRRARREAFSFQPVDEKIIDEVNREEDARLNGNPDEKDTTGSGFYTTNTVRRMDTQTVHMMNTTGSISVQGGQRRPMSAGRMAAMIIPLVCIIVYILSLVCVDMFGLFGWNFGISPRMIVLYTVFLILSVLGVLFLMFMDMLPKPLALLVIFVSMFCVHGNLFLIVPMIISFIAIALTVRGVYLRICAFALAAIMLLCGVIMWNKEIKTTWGDRVESDDGEYSLVLRTTDDGRDLSYTLILESDGDLFRRWEVEDGYVDSYYFTDDGDIAFGKSNQYGMPQIAKTVRISDVVK